jgi:hypothetical protein
VQVVAYLHEWAPSAERAGEFFFWNGRDRLGTKEQPLSRAGSGVDGTKIVHAATVYFPSKRPPLLQKDDDARLRFDATEEAWEVVKLEPAATTAKATAAATAAAATTATAAMTSTRVASYNESDLRTSIVYRARCFADAAEAAAYKAQMAQPGGPDDPNGEGMRNSQRMHVISSKRGIAPLLSSPSPAL